MRQILLLIVAAGALCGFAADAYCTPIFFVLQRDARFIQNGPSTTAGDGFQFLGRATPNDGIGPIDFNDGTFSFPAGSPLSPAPMGPSGAELRYSSGKIDQATLQANYPNGIYTFHMTDSANAAHTQTEAVDSTIVAAPATIGLLSAASFNALQGMDPTKALTLTFNQFTDSSPNGLIFFAVQDASGNTPIFDGLQPNVTSDIIPANTLKAGTQYSFFLFFDNIAITSDNQGEVLLDNRTTGSFSTAVPEPAGALIAVLGIGLICTLRRGFYFSDRPTVSAT